MFITKQEPLKPVDVVNADVYADEHTDGQIKQRLYYLPLGSIKREVIL